MINRRRISDRSPGFHSAVPTVYSFVPLPGCQQQKRPRRRYEEIERIYNCNYDNCNKAYGTLNHLNAHVTMQGHGQKRTPEEFREARREWKQKKKDEEARRSASRSSAGIGPAGSGLSLDSSSIASTPSISRSHSTASSISSVRTPQSVGSRPYPPHAPELSDQQHYYSRPYPQPTNVLYSLPSQSQINYPYQQPQYPQQQYDSSYTYYQPAIPEDRAE